ncbi:hydroxyneurosporene-O-methyltransferase [Burkholderia pseudomallei]|nr:hydroxyneurosporene-O-methyltransferase [Burkholderia pseudomallei]CAJ7297516.1 hydroxyneurosporene-O-methyltransferase [Burkholderia pseudomallei]
MKTAPEEVADMIFLWKWGSQTLCAGALLGVFDHLDRQEPHNAQAIAATMHVDAPLLYRLLRALASLELLNETKDHHFTLTERGYTLRTDAPGSLRYMAMLEGGAEHWALWKHVPAMVKDGRQNAFMREFGQMAFDYARSHPDGYGTIFGRAMSSFSSVQSLWALDALRHYDFSGMATWCDIAGGHGHLMCSFLETHPHLSGTVFDLPEVISQTDQLWAHRMGLDGRCRYVAGDMFEEIPAVADVYSLKMILHDWNDEECKQILINMRRSSKPTSKAFIIEHVVPDPEQPHFSKLFDVHMMCWGTGKERTEHEYAELLQDSGWRFVRCHYPSHASMGVIEAVAA